MKRITILVVEDHTVVREGFHRILKLKDDFEVVGEAQDGRQALTLAKKLRPAVVLMDISLPLFNGLINKSPKCRDEWEGLPIQIPSI
jgi:DNA-binding NarL/FixJ family response regulator